MIPREKIVSIIKKYDDIEKELSSGKLNLPSYKPVARLRYRDYIGFTSNFYRTQPNQK